jgi:hypothetical protein
MVRSLPPQNRSESTKGRFVVPVWFALTVALLTVGCPSSQRGRAPVGSPLSAVPTPSEVSEQPFLFSATFTTGAACSDPCNGELVIKEASGAGEDTFLTLLSYAQFGDPTPLVNSGVLSLQSRAYLHSALDQLSSVSLETQYPGCGAACDSWNVVLQYTAPSRPTIHTLYTRDRLGDTPTAVEVLDGFVRSLVQDLSTCQATERVAPRADCVPIS